MKKIILILIFFVSTLYLSCKSENPVNTGEVTNDYIKILTIDSGNYRIELYNRISNVLYVGYNEIGFKVFSNGIEEKTGFLKYRPVMYHLNGYGHTTPVQSDFYYDNSVGLFTGYVCYSMLSDSTSMWFGDYNYNNQFSINHRQFDVILGIGSQMRIWLDLNTNILYYMTLYSPKNPQIGLNNFKVILHKTVDNYIYSEVDSAKMFIRPWMPSHGHGSSNNSNPILLNHGRYEGVVNFTMPGQWFVYDSIVVNNSTISTSSLYLVFDVR